MQTELFRIIVSSPDIPEVTKNKFIVHGFKFNLEHENPDLC